MDIPDKIISIISVVLALISAAVAILSYLSIKPENVPQIIQPFLIVPWYGYVILFLIFIIIHLMRKKKGRRFPLVVMGQDLEKVGTIDYSGVKWDVRAPVPSMYESPSSYENRLSDIIRVKIPPKCPKCGVELEERNTFFGGYLWSCVGCGFSKVNPVSFYTEAQRAERLWRGAHESGTLTKEE
jgi:ribosomal protein L37AE/L43A